MREEGLFPWARRVLFGARVERLSERKNRAHLLSYLLIFAQSIAVLLVFGHAEVGLIFDPRWPLKVVAMLVLALLVITVLAADWALIESITRLGPLGRNQQTWTWLEHFVYAAFVFIVEGATFGVVLDALDSNPTALVNWQPLIPTSGALFYAIVVLRVLLTGWAGIQLILVRAPLPVLLSTLMNTGKEIIGAQLERMLKSLDLANQNLPALFQVYAAMSKPRRPLGGWRLKAAKAREEEEDRQAKLIHDGLVALTGATMSVALPAPRAAASNPDAYGIAAHPTHLLSPAGSPRTSPMSGPIGPVNQPVTSPSGRPKSDSWDDLDPEPPDDGGGLTFDEDYTGEIPAVSGFSLEAEPDFTPSRNGHRARGKVEPPARRGRPKYEGLTDLETELLRKSKHERRLEIARTMMHDNPAVKRNAILAELGKPWNKGLSTNQRTVDALMAEVWEEEERARPFVLRAAGLNPGHNTSGLAVNGGPVTAPLS